jgi:hypothetical protein
MPAALRRGERDELRMARSSDGYGFRAPRCARPRNDKGVSFSFVLETVLKPASLLPSRPARGCFRRCLVAGRHRRARVWLATAGLGRGGGLKERGPQGLRSEGLMRCPDCGGHVPWSRVLTVCRDRRGCQARPRETGSRPSSPGRTSGRFCASWVRPRDAVSIRCLPAGEVRAQALEVLGRQPSLVAPKRGTRDQSRRGAGRCRSEAGRPACLLPPGPQPGSTAPRAPSSFKRTRKSEGPNPRASRAAG